MANLVDVHPANRENYESPFSITRRHQIHYWLANMIILPSYLVAIIQCTLWAFENSTLQALLALNSSCGTTQFLFPVLNSPCVTTQFLFPVLIFALILVVVVSLSPLVLSLSTFVKPHWRTGFKHRATAVAISLIFAVFTTQMQSPFAKTYAWLTSIFGVYGIITFCFSNPTRTKLSVLAGSMLVILSFIITAIDSTLINNVNVDEIIKVIASLAMLLNFFAIVIYFFGRKWRSLRAIDEDILPLQSSSQIVAVVLITSLSLLWIAATVNSSKLRLPPVFDGIIAPLGITVSLFLAAQPRRILSRQRAYIRQAFAVARHGNYRNIASPSLNKTSFFSRVLRWIRRNLHIDNARYWASISFFFGAVINPLIQISLYNGNYLREPNSLLSLIALGVTSGTVSLILYVTIWVVRNRQRYVVQPLEVKGVASSETDAVQGIANQLTHNLVEQIQQIGMLLQLRRVENSETSSGTVLSHFVASGQEPDFIKDLQSLISTNDAAKSSPAPVWWLAGAMNLLANTLAVIRIRGTLRRRPDGSLEIWVELSRRRSQVVAVDLVVIAPSHSDDLDEITVKRVTREIAIKLVLKLGRNSHLGSSWQSLEQFLDGLNAVTTGNLWRAVASFRASIQNEETTKGAFGIGHYQLGATLVLLGELDEGRKHLELAETEGPPLAENHYLLALLRVNEAWHHLDTEAIKFEEVVRRCNMALALRSDFAEAYHLLGSTHYHRGKLKQREFSRQYGQEIPKNSRWTYPTQHIADYRLAAHYFMKASQLYERRLRKLVLMPDTQVGLQGELARLFEIFMAAKHQVGDALRSLGQFAEAETYYEDVLSAYPANMRTLIDLTKTHCLAEQWQRADEFASRSLLVVPEARWSPDANLYMGWLLSGGVYEEATLSIPWQIVRQLSKLKLLKFVWSSPKSHELERLLANAMKHLEYAIQMRPRFMARWEQTDWQYAFLAAHAALQPQEPKKPILDLKRNENVFTMLDFDEAGKAINETDASRHAAEGIRDLSTALAEKEKKVTRDLKSRLNNLPDRINDFLKEKKSIDAVHEINAAISLMKQYHLLIEKYRKCINEYFVHELNSGNQPPFILSKYLESFEIKVGNRERVLRGFRKTLISCIHTNTIPSDETRMIKDKYLPLWLAWMLDCYGFNDKNDSLVIMIGQESEDANPSHLANDDGENYPSKEFAKIYAQMRIHKQQLIMLMDAVKSAGRFHGMTHAWSRLQLAASMLDNWKRVNDRVMIDNIEGITFARRWENYVYSEIAVLTTRILVEAEAYEVAWSVADASINKLKQWEEYWKTKYSSNDMTFRFAPYKFRHSRATLLAYKAYAALQFKEHSETEVRLRQKNFTAPTANRGDQDIREIGISANASNNNVLAPEHARAQAPQDIKEALSYLPRHPLAMFVQAMIYKDQRLYDAAANELHRLLAVISPFDPGQYIAIMALSQKPSMDNYRGTDAQGAIRLDQIAQKLAKVEIADGDSYEAFCRNISVEESRARLDLNPIVKTGDTHSQSAQNSGKHTKLFEERLSQYADKSIRSRMADQESVSGQKQFDHIVNRARIHKLLSEIYVLDGKSQLGIEHLTAASALATYRDDESDYLLELAENLEKLDRFRDAQAVISALRTRRYYLETQTFSITKVRQPEILDCIMLSRLRNFDLALTNGYRLWHQWTGQRFNPVSRSSNSLADFRSYRERLAHPDVIYLYCKCAEFLQSCLANNTGQDWLQYAPFETTAHNIQDILLIDSNSRDNHAAQNEANNEPAPKKFDTIDLVYSLANCYLDADKASKLLSDLLGQSQTSPMPNLLPPLVVLTEKFDIEDTIRLKACKPTLDIVHIITSRITDFLSRESLRAMEQFVQLANNIVYSRVELGDDAPKTELVNGHALPFIVPNESAIKVVLSVQKEMLRFASSQAPDHTAKYRRALSDYHDTNAWRIFRSIETYRKTELVNEDNKYGLHSPEPAQNILRRLEEAREELTTNALHYTQGNAIAHYHLARVHLAMIERLWQGLQNTKEETVFSITAVFQGHLRHASNHLRAARGSDRNGRLRSRLDWLGQRIEKYSKRWEQRFLKSLED